MEKEIKEDFTIFWPLVCVLAAIAIVFALLAGASGLFLLHDWHIFAFLVGISLVTVWFVRFGLRSSLARAKASPKRWLLSYAGLTRVYASNQRETIRWEQLQDLRWGKHLGLKIRWEESRYETRLREFRDEFHKPRTGRYECWLRIREDQARELFQCAKRDWVNIGL